VESSLQRCIVEDNLLFGIDGDGSVRLTIEDSIIRNHGFEQIGIEAGFPGQARLAIARSTISSDNGVAGNGPGFDLQPLAENSSVRSLGSNVFGALAPSVVMGGLTS
jgi:hypothetical protein